MVGLLSGLAMLAGCLTNRPEAVDVSGPVVRVRLFAGVEHVDLDVGGTTRRVTAVQIDKPTTIASAAGEVVGVNGSGYRGRIQLVPVGPGRFDVINHVQIDDYLRGVVPREMPASWPIEALKAQAIVARTYALYEAKTTRPAAHFDLYADTRSQVYGGVADEKPQSNLAVHSTKGLVVAAGPPGQERIFKAYFSSTCGGVSQTAGDAFGDGSENAVFAPRLSDGCTMATYFTWPDVVIPKAEITRRLSIYGQRQGLSIAGIGRVASITVAARNSLQRPSRFAITDVNGRTFTLSSEQTRHALNTDRPENFPLVRSSFFEPIDAGDSIAITGGRGWGHGVGMCQWCARTFATRGMTAEQIVKTSYPTSVIARAY